MRDETGLSCIYLPSRSSLPAWEALGSAVNAHALGVQRQGKPVTHLSLEVHRFPLRPIIRALPWARRSAAWTRPRSRYLEALRGEADTLVPTGLAQEAADSRKFSYCLPDGMALRTVQARLADAGAVRALITSPIVSVA